MSRRQLVPRQTDTETRSTYLEGDAEVPAISIRDLFPNLTLPSTTEDNGRARALRHEARRLQVRLLQVDIPAISAHVRRADERRALLRHLVHLQDLPLDEVSDDAGDELDDLALPKARERRARAPEQEVPAEDGVLVPKRRGRGRRPATQVGAVDHVVVQQRRDVYHLDDLREPRLRRERRDVVRERQGGLRRGRPPRRGKGRRGPGRTRGHEGEDRGEGGGVVWHARVPVVQHVRARERAVELLRASARALAFGSPFFLVPVRA